MKRILLIAAAIILATPAQAQRHGVPQGVPGDSPPKPTQTYEDTSDVEAQAEDLRLKGRCDLAVPILRRLSARAGYEVARYHLGQCLLTLADAEHDATHAADLRHEGASWILRAASAGFAQAESMAVTLCLDGIGMEKDPVEAEKWALVYRHNGMRSILNLPDIDSDVSDRLDAALTDTTRSQAEARAEAWSPVMRTD
jgi:TPR repeat protein